jgi:glycosyltransferase involved in cell wall biosynthesis
MAVWTPVDHLPAPPLVVQHFRTHGSVPIAMSRYGEEQLRNAKCDPLYVPHSVDTDAFQPRDRVAARERFGFDKDAFLVGMVSTNNSVQPCRKAYPEAFAAFAMLTQIAPDAMLYVHAEQRGLMGGIDLGLLATARGITPDRLIFADQYRYRQGLISPVELSWLYSAFDVLLFPSLGEGFGIPALEAQACGTAVIVSDFAAQTELVAPGTGFCVTTQPYWDNAQAADFGVPIIADIYDALETAAARRDELHAFADARREFAMGYERDHVFDEYWRPALAQLERELPSTEPIVL